MGTKVDDYWDNGKAMLQDPPKFLQSLFDYNKDNIPDSVIQKIQPYIDNDEFKPEAISKVGSIVRASHTGQVRIYRGSPPPPISRHFLILDTLDCRDEIPLSKLFLDQVWCQTDPQSAKHPKEYDDPNVTLSV